MFGGYNASLPFSSPLGEQFAFSYFADTFIYDPEPADGSSPIWKQVITRGFPTYRAQCAVFSDPETGKVYMFGGTCQRYDFAFSRSLMSDIQDIQTVNRFQTRRTISLVVLVISGNFV